MKSKNSNASFNQDGSDGISEFSISYDSNNGNISIGNKRPHRSYTSSREGNNYVYKINEDVNGNISTWVSTDGHHVKKGDKEIHVISGSGTGSKIRISKDGEGEIHVISSSGTKSNIWVTKDNDRGEIIIKADTIFFENKNEGDGTIFLFNSDEEDDDSIFVPSGSEKEIFISKDNKNMALFIIDGKKATDDLMIDLDPKTIDKIDVIRGDEAIEKYGEEAKYGVILITTKKN